MFSLYQKGYKRRKGAETKTHRLNVTENAAKCTRLLGVANSLPLVA